MVQGIYRAALRPLYISMHGGDPLQLSLYMQTACYNYINHKINSDHLSINLMLYGTYQLLQTSLTQQSLGPTPNLASKRLLV